MREIPVSKVGPALSSYRWLKTPYPYLDDLRARYGDAFQMSLFGLKFTLFSNPDDVREVFSDGGEELEAGKFNQTLSALLGDQSVLMTDGRAHLRKRKLLLPPFHGERMQAY